MTEQVVYTGSGRPGAKEFLRRTFTPKGNEEAWRQKHAKEIEQLKQIHESLSPEDRAKAIEQMEKKIASSAKWRVARNYGVTLAVVGEAVLIGNKPLAEKLAKKKYIGFVGKQALGIRGGIEGFIGKIGNKNLKKYTPDILADGLSGAIKLSALDLLDEVHPITPEFIEKALTPGLFANSPLQDSLAEDVVRSFLQKAKKFGRWVTYVVLPGHESNMISDPDRGMNHLLKRHLVVYQQLDDGTKLFIPKEQLFRFIEDIIRKHNG